MSVALTLFTVSVCYTLYILVGYPLILALLARFKSRPVHRDPGYLPEVSVVLTVRDGQQWIGAKLDNLLSGLDYPPERFEVIVISDGSADDTDAIIDSYSDPRLRFVRTARGGKAAALNRGIGMARGEIVFLTDVRQTLHPMCLRKLAACFADPEIGAASGELIITKGQSEEERQVGLYWKYEKLIRKRLSAVASVFGASGSIYAIRRSLIRALPPYTLDDDVYLPLCAFFAGYRVIFEEAAIAYDYPTGLASEYYRKVRTLAGIYQVIGFFPGLLWPGTPGWIHFMSHKFGRMLVPWTLLVAFVTSFWLSQPVGAAVLLLEILALGSALADAFIPEDLYLKRWTSAIRAFLVMMFAAGSATSIFFRPADSLWKRTQVSTAIPSGKVVAPYAGAVAARQLPER